MSSQPRLVSLLAGVMIAVPIAGAATESITGGGATFPAPLYEKWLASFQASHPGLPIHYDAIGSGQGLARLQSHQLEFAASDIPVVGDERTRLGFEVVVFPAIAGGVVPVYNLPGTPQNLRFGPEALAGIFAGRIQYWDDPAIRKSNRSASPPHVTIQVVYRSDASGTSFAWSSFLADHDPAWKSRIANGAVMKWPTGSGATGNEGVAQQVQAIPHSLGYVEFIYAVEKHLSYGAVANYAGKFIQPNEKSIRQGVTDLQQAEAYPIVALTYFVAPRQIPDAAKRARLFEFFTWVFEHGQNEAAALGYIALPPQQLSQSQAAIKVWAQ